MLTEMIEHGVMCVLLLLLCISISNARLTGASNTSCYNHVINHRTILQMYDVVNCVSSSLCTDVSLHVSCPMQDNLVCCRDFTSTPVKTLYTQCNYTFSFTPSTNLGFLVQAREVEPSELSGPTFNASSSIIGTWDSGPDHQQLWCKTSIQSVNESTVPNSITHTGAYRADDVNAPSSINMTWYANTTTPNSDTERSSIYIAFFYTISRDVSTNFYPFTTSHLLFRLRVKSPDSSLTTHSLQNEISSKSVDSLTTHSLQNYEVNNKSIVSTTESSVCPAVNGLYLSYPVFATLIVILFILVVVMTIIGTIFGWKTSSYWHSYVYKANMSNTHGIYEDASAVQLHVTETTMVPNEYDYIRDNDNNIKVCNNKAYSKISLAVSSQ